MTKELIPPTSIAPNEQLITLFLKEENCFEILPPEDFLLILNKMIDYPNSVGETTRLIEIMEDICSRNPGVHFNWNTDIKRLLVCRYPKKIVFSKKEDVSDFLQSDTDIATYNIRDIRITTGIMTKGEEYEDKKIQLLKSQVVEILKSASLIGCYGQLTFLEHTTEKEVTNFFQAMFEELASHKIAMISSGSLLGVSGLAHKVAVERGIPTVGIIPKTIEHLVDGRNFNFLIKEGVDWGEGSFVFGRLPDYIVFAGGGYWSFLEYQSAQKHKVPVDFLGFSGLCYSPELEEHTQLSFLYTEDNFAKLFEKMKESLF